MTTHLITLSAVLAVSSLAVLAASVAALAYDRLTSERDAVSTAGTDGHGSPDADGEGSSPAPGDQTGAGVTAAAADQAPDEGHPSTSAVLLQEKLRAYREISGAIIALNRAALDLSTEEFREAADAIAFDRESPLSDHYLDANAAYESNLYLVDKGVCRAASDYVDYLATYHDEGAHAGGLLGRAGDVYEAMRADLGLERLFDEDETPPGQESANDIPDPLGEEPTVEDYREDLGDLSDLEYFSPRNRDDRGDGGAADTADPEADVAKDRNESPGPEQSDDDSQGDDAASGPGVQSGDRPDR